MSGFDNFLDSAGKTLEVAPKLYEDVAQPTLKEAGKTGSILGRAINAALEPMQLWILRREYNIERTKILLEKELVNVEPEKIVPPEPYVFIPAAQAISYCMDSEELRGMFAKLLAKSMVEETKSSVHPSFVEIIKQMSPVDACVLRLFTVQAGYPIAEFRLVLKKGGYRVMNTDIFLDAQAITDFSNASMSISNMQRLGLVSIYYDISFRDDTAYKPFENSPFFRLAKSQVEKEPEIFAEAQVQKGVIILTTAGKSFIGTCIS